MVCVLYSPVTVRLKSRYTLEVTEKLLTDLILELTYASSYYYYSMHYHKRRNVHWGLIFVGRHPHEN